MAIATNVEKEMNYFFKYHKLLDAGDVGLDEYLRGGRSGWVWSQIAPFE